MKVIKRMLLLSILIILIMGLVQNNIIINASITDNVKNPVRAAVLLYDSKDAFISILHKDFEDTEKMNEGKVKFTFYDAKNDQSIQNRTLDKILTEKSADIIMLNMVNPEKAREAVNKIKEYNIPVILFNREPENMNDIKSYAKAYFVGADEAEAGILEGQIIVNLWNKDKQSIDRNRDNKLQYIMIIGQGDSKEAMLRTKNSILEINKSGIQTEQLASTVCDWNRDIARRNFGSLLLSNINRVEAVISNNDEMAIGAIEALHEFGYNKGRNSKMIPVVGIDATPMAKELIKSGEMSGSVYQPSPNIAVACYEIGMNLVNGKKPLEGTTYKFDNSGVAVRIQFEKIA